MSFLLSLITSNRSAVAGLAVAVAISLGAAGVQTYRLAAESEDHARTKAEHAEYLAGLDRAAREAEALARAEEQRRFAALQGAIDDAEQRLEQARADADAASDAGDRLRQRVAQLSTACRVSSGDTGAAGGGQPADATGDLLADVQRRIDEATERIARFADQAHAAGLACQNSYRALSP